MFKYFLGLNWLFPFAVTYFADNNDQGGGGGSDDPPADPPENDDDPPADPPTPDGDKDAEYYKQEAQKAFKKRDELKEELAKVQGKLREIEDGELMKKGEHETVITNLKAEIEELKSKAEKAEALEAKVLESEKKERKDLLSQLSEKDKKFADKKFDSLEDLREYVELHKEKGDTDGNRGGDKTPKNDGSATSKFADSIYKKN